MNLNIVLRQLSVVAWLIGLTMLFSISAAWPEIGGQSEFETRGFWALLASMVVCGIVGLILRMLSGKSNSTLYRKEAMAVVGLSWLLATVLGGLPYYFGKVIYTTVDGLEVPMGLADCIFESQSGFSTTGATVLTDIENPEWVPRCILFWRSSTHFLGGLGIIVLFVAILGQGSAGKALMRAEMPGPSKEGSQERMQHAAWNFAGIYCMLNLILTIILYFEGMTWFEAICHAFGTMATGGFSTLNASLGGFHSKTIEYTVILFMILAGTNFTLIYLLTLGKLRKFVTDPEWRTYIGILAIATILVIVVGIFETHDFDRLDKLSMGAEFELAFRDGLFQVVSIMTTTGYCTADFDLWNNFSRGLLVVLMFVGGCAGSTGGGMKVIRIILFTKIIGREVEHSYHPAVVRHIRLAGEPITEPAIAHNILVYVGLIGAIIVVSWLGLMWIELDTTWIEAGQPVHNKLIDSGTAVCATLHNIGPGLGIVGATRNYAPFSDASKMLFTLLMMLGRLELFAVLVLVMPSFWRD